YPLGPGAVGYITYTADGYIIAREGEALLGSTMENAGFEAEVTSAGLASIFSTATSLCPGLAKQDVSRTWAGLRPVTPDGLPIVGREPSVEGLWLATGHGRNGILLAAITGLLIAEMMSGDSTTIEDLDALKALDPVRFWRW
ncbi:MAG: FAD-dependent oxidoreductase, partial [Gemmatimonadetes bacterium]|nr:FAD-dependent oxidoreductase [Gemmatimonadota bacterium]